MFSVKSQWKILHTYKNFVLSFIAKPYDRYSTKARLQWKNKIVFTTEQPMKQCNIHNHANLPMRNFESIEIFMFANLLEDVRITECPFKLIIHNTN